MIVGGWRPVPKSPGGEGDAETVTTAEGSAEQFAFFTAGAA